MIYCDVHKKLCTNMHMHVGIRTCMYSVPLLSTSCSHVILTIIMQYMCTLFTIIFEIRIDNRFLVSCVLVCSYLIIWDVHISAGHAYL